ncbi:MAG: class I SAM-dependent methyltransferase [Victivallaceae bacterium]
MKTFNRIAEYRFACKIAKDKSVLDVACGPGDSAPMFLDAGVNSYVGIDINEKQLEYANYKYSYYKHMKHDAGKVNYHVGDIRTFNNGKTFDIITCYGIIEHVNDYEVAIKNLYSLLNHGGVLLISSYNRLLTSPFYKSVDDKPANEEPSQKFTPNELLWILNSCGFYVNQDNLFGRHQRKFYANKALNRLNQVIFDKFMRKKNPAFTRVTDKEPEHFIIVATKI